MVLTLLSPLAVLLCLHSLSLLYTYQDDTYLNPDFTLICVIKELKPALSPFDVLTICT